MAKATHEVNHPKLFLRVDGKLQQVEQGSQVALTKDNAEKLGGKVKLIGAKKQVDIDPKSEDKVD